MAKRYTQTVPSGFFCTDLFLYLNHLFMGGLLKPSNEGETDRALAAQEATDMKRLMGALRFLWRSSSLAAFFNSSNKMSKDPSI